MAIFTFESVMKQLDLFLVLDPSQKDWRLKKYQGDELAAKMLKQVQDIVSFVTYQRLME